MAFKIIIAIILLIAIIIMFRRATSCFDDGKKLGTSKSCNNILESKENKVFIKQLKVDKEYIILNKEKIYLQESWLEYGWSYECINDQIMVEKDTSSQHIIIKFKNINWNDYMEWYNSELGSDMGGISNGAMIFSTKGNNLEPSQIKFYRLKKRYEFNGGKILLDSITIR